MIRVSYLPTLFDCTVDDVTAFVAGQRMSVEHRWGQECHFVLHKSHVCGLRLNLGPRNEIPAFKRREANKYKYRQAHMQISRFWVCL